MGRAKHKWLHRLYPRKLHYENKQNSCYGLLEDPAVTKTNTHSSKQRVHQVAAKAAWPWATWADDVKAQTIPPLKTPSLLRCYYVLYPEDGGSIVFRNALTLCNIPEDPNFQRRHCDKLKSRNSSSFPTQSLVHSFTSLPSTHCTDIQQWIKAW